MLFKASQKQKYTPNNELIKLSMSLKNGMTSAITHAKTQVPAMIPVQTPHPTAVWNTDDVIH